MEPPFQNTSFRHGRNPETGNGQPAPIDGLDNGREYGFGFQSRKTPVNFFSEGVICPPCLLLSPVRGNCQRAGR